MAEVSRQRVALLLKINIKSVMPGIVAHACNPTVWEAEAGGSLAPGNPAI